MIAAHVNNEVVMQGIAEGMLIVPAGPGISELPKTRKSVNDTSHFHSIAIAKELLDGM